MGVDLTYLALNFYASPITSPAYSTSLTHKVTYGALLAGTLGKVLTNLKKLRNL